MINQKQRQILLPGLINVLFEESTDNGLMEGFSENYVRLAVPYDPLLINTVQPVRYKSIMDSGHVKGEILIVGR